ncbi:MAG: uncharacterized protein KVP18_002978 [Porospora cf. gigantea A]|uniref:uncharacterized protein n=1 Tax=Porospora cf. gigantea A TaxID=2853593 RepID=UPI00355939CF|nr:MAG: hypothetical protein KVP18_002978 [Porospora cf. gigantea A]
MLASVMESLAAEDASQSTDIHSSSDIALHESVCSDILPSRSSEEHSTESFRAVSTVSGWPDFDKSLRLQLTARQVSDLPDDGFYTARSTSESPSELAAETAEASFEVDVGAQQSQENSFQTSVEPHFTPRDKGEDSSEVPCHASSDTTMSQRVAALFASPEPLPEPPEDTEVPPHLATLLEEVDGEIRVKETAVELLQLLEQLGETHSLDELGWTLLVSGQTVENVLANLQKQIDEEDMESDWTDEVDDDAAKNNKTHVLPTQPPQSIPVVTTARASVSSLISQEPPKLNMCRRVACWYLDLMNRGPKRRKVLKYTCGYRAKPRLLDCYEQHRRRQKYFEQQARQTT